MLAPWKKGYDKPRQCIKKQRHYFANKAMVFPVVMYGCGRWTIKKADHQRADAFELWCWRKLLRVSWTAMRSNHLILKEINTEYSLEGLMMKVKLQYFGQLIRRTVGLEKTLMLGKTESRKRRGWQRTRWFDGNTDSMDVSLSKSGRWWRTGKPSMLQSMGLHRVRQDWATELKCWTTINRRMSDPSKKRYPTSTGKGEAPARW